MYCAECGKELAENSKFCTYCGTKTGIEYEMMRDNGDNVRGNNEENASGSGCIGTAVVICILLAVIFLAGYFIVQYSGVQGGRLSGKYTSVSKSYTVEFKWDGTCTWYQSGTYFEGTYKKTDDGWQINIEGHGLYSNTVFIAKPKGKDLVISGGRVRGETFIKQ